MDRKDTGVANRSWWLREGGSTEARVPDAPRKVQSERLNVVPGCKLSLKLCRIPVVQKEIQVSLNAYK